MEYKIKVNLGLKDAFFLVFIYLISGVIFAIIGGLLFFIPFAPAFIVAVYSLFILIYSIKYILEATKITREDVEISNKTTIIQEKKQNIYTSTTSNMENKFTKSDEFSKLEKEYYSTNSEELKKEIREKLLKSKEFEIKEQEYCLDDEATLIALMEAEDIFAELELYKRNKK